MEREKVSFEVTGVNGRKYMDTEPATNIHVSDGVVVRKKKMGVLIVCDNCMEYKWECQTYPNGDTWCTKVCVRWGCHEVPAGSGSGPATN